MIHELVEIISEAVKNQQNGIKQVLATVVALDGSSYRKPGVRMLLSEQGKMTGAVSGGCVEKEVLRRSGSVFETGVPKVITYDGRYRLGCEGTLYILLEPLELSNLFLEAFDRTLMQRRAFKVHSYFEPQDECQGQFGSVIEFENTICEQPLFLNTAKVNDNLPAFTQSLNPRFRLLIIGGEHDAVKLCKLAYQLGWQIDVITSHLEEQHVSDFPGANSVRAEAPEFFSIRDIDQLTAVVVMTHNYAKDLKYVLQLAKANPAYLGVIGSARRRDRMHDDLLERAPAEAFDLMENMFSPAGLNIDAVTPEEIALSILTEIVAVTRNKEPLSLRNVSGRIHSYSE